MSNVVAVKFNYSIALEVYRHQVQIGHEALRAHAHETQLSHADLFRLRHFEARLLGHTRSNRFQVRFYNLALGLHHAGLSTSRIVGALQRLGSFYNFNPSSPANEIETASRLRFVPDIIVLAVSQRTRAWRSHLAHELVGQIHEDLFYGKAATLLQSLIGLCLDGASSEQTSMFFLDELERMPELKVAAQTDNGTEFWESDSASALVRATEWSLASNLEWSSLNRKLDGFKADPYLRAVACAFLLARKTIRLQDCLGPMDYRVATIEHEVDRIYGYQHAYRL